MERVASSCSRRSGSPSAFLSASCSLWPASKLPAIRVIAIIFIEVIRGVPLISILFMASVMLPLFMPSGVTVDKLLRAQIAIVIFAAAYIAEAVRGTCSDPQRTARGCQAMGLHYWQAMRLIVLPQALKISIPPLVNISIGFFQDTTLVTIIGLLDFLHRSHGDDGSERRHRRHGRLRLRSRRVPGVLIWHGGL